jgi:ankyrin repeat protein
MTTRDDWFENQQLHFAAQDGDPEKVKELLRRGCDPNAFDDLSKTPLHYATEQGRVEIMRVLIEAGADANAHEANKIGNTPLREVAGECSFEGAKALVEAGADPLIPGWMGITALDLSRKRKKPEGRRVHELLLGAVREHEKRQT